MKRRTFLKGTVASSAVALAAGAGILAPSQVLAAWPKAAFDAKDLNKAMTGVLGSDLTEASDKINIKAPDIAENGAVVPVTVSSDIGNAEKITLFSEKNATPLAASFILGSGAQAFVSTRIKMGKTSNVIAVVTAGGTNYSARKEVKVTIGGCGG